MRPLFLLFALTIIAPAAERVPWTTSRVHGTPEPPSPFRVERVFPALTFVQPIETAAVPGTNRIAVAEVKGQILSFPAQDGVTKADPMADLVQYEPETVECYGLTFHPKFPENRFAYVWINLNMKGQKSRADGSRIVRFRVTEQEPPRFDLASAQVIFTFTYGGHNGGNLRFGPDGMLYLGTGDGSFAHPPDSNATGQSIADLYSSVLRIDVDHPAPPKNYSVPKDNPFVGFPGARGEVWAYGVRNPWRLAFDAKTGDLWLGDVGWELWESVIRVERGGNYGWSITEASRQDVWPDRPKGPTPILPPTWAHSHEESVSITGGEVYYGSRLPELTGRYVYGDWQLGTFWSIKAGEPPQELCHSTLMPVGFGVAPDSEPLICDWAGGGLWRLARNPAAGQPSRFPTRLSETGLFTETKEQAAAPGVQSFEIVAPRWADHATAQRWLALPKGEVTVAAKDFGILQKGRWVFPDGTVLAKTYGIEMEQGKAASRRLLETQLLHYDGAQWAAYSYRWNEAQTDAELVPARGAEQTLEIKDAAAPGGTRKQTWRYFSRAECLRCHNLQAGTLMSFHPLQLDRTVAAAPGGQLEHFHQLGLLPAEEPRFADPHGDRGTLEVRARSYLHANCSGCHRTHGGGSVPTVLNIDAVLRDAKLIGAKPVQGDLGLLESRVVAAGAPVRSVLLYRLATEGRGHMPYLGGRLVDDRGVLLIRDWIASMPLDKDLPPAARQAMEEQEQALAKLAGGDAAPLPKLLETTAGALGVALAVLDGSLPAAVRQAAIAQGSALPDPLRRDLFERFLPDAQRRHILGPGLKAESLLTQHGDAARGQLLFTALCGACHRVGQTGTDFGPDLSHVATKHQRPSLIEQILQPSKVIEPAWQLTTLTVQGGEPLTGFVTERSEGDLTLRMAGGETRRVPLPRIVKTEIAKVSLMPEGLLQSLTAQEAADLIEYLEAQK